MLSRKAEDYLEAILGITEEKGYTRVKDIAIALDIQPSSVVEMLKNFVRFVKSAPDYPQWLQHFRTFCETGVHPCEADKQKGIGSSDEPELT